MLCHLNFGGERGHIKISEAFILQVTLGVFMVNISLVTWQKQPLVLIT